MEDGLTRDHFGKRTDKTGERDLSISQWHRKKLSNKCLATDIDFMEYRFQEGKPIPKAIFEYKQWHVVQDKYVLSANTKAIFELSKLSGIPFYFVWYKKEENGEFKFKVWEVREDFDYKKARDYSEEEFINFIENL